MGAMRYSKGIRSVEQAQLAPRHGFPGRETRLNEEQVVIDDRAKVMVRKTTRHWLQRRQSPIELMAT